MCVEKGTVLLDIMPCFVMVVVMEYTDASFQNV